MGWIGELIGAAVASGALTFLVVRFFLLLAGARFSAPRQILSAYLAGGLAVFGILAMGASTSAPPDVNLGLSYGIGLALVVGLEWLRFRAKFQG